MLETLDNASQSQSEILAPSEGLETPEASEKEVTLALPTQADVPFLVQIGEMAKEASTGSGYTPERRAEKEAKLSATVEDPTQHHKLPRLIKDGPHTVGYISYDTSPRTPSMEIPGLLDDYPDFYDEGARWHNTGSAIAPEYRRQGHWTAAAKAVEETAKAQGVKYMTTDIGAENTAMIAARTKLGYKLYQDPNTEVAGYKPGTKLFGVKKL